MEEIWKDVVGYEGLYQVSNNGLIKELSRIIHQKKGIKITNDKILNNYLNSCGYNLVSLKNPHNNKRKLMLSHRIVAVAFIINHKTKRTVNHKNGIKTDNRVDNLEWMTYSENHLHSFRKLNRKSAHISRFGINNPSSKRVYQYSKSGEFIKLFNAIKDAERETSINQSLISNCCAGRLKTAKGYIWKFE